MLWMLGAALFFSASVGFVRHLSDTLSTFEIVFLRQVIGVLFMIPWLMRIGVLSMRTQRLPMLTLRAALSYTGMLASYYSYKLIPLADAVSLQFTTPLFTTILAIVFLKEIVGSHRWAALVFGFIGVVIIVRPGFEAINAGVPIALFAALVYGGSNVANRALTSTESTSVIMFYGFLLQLPMAAIPAAMNWVTPGWDEALPLLGFGIVAFGAQYCLTRSLAMAEASLVEPVMFIRLPCVAVIGYFLFAQVPDMWTWVGAAVIFASTYGLARMEAAQETKTGGG
jgi:drug/metabolite transporter (DMT)-like permease